MNIDDIFVNYVQYGIENKIDMVFLHGWGQNIEMMLPLANKFKHQFRITIIDLPGFGKSSEPKEPIGVKGYSEIVKKLLDNLKVENPILVGHSFGGRISLIYGATHKVRKIILLGAPFRKDKEKKHFKEKLLKGLKKIPVLHFLENWAKNKIGSTDYKQASPLMKKILVKTVNEDLANYAKKIKSETLLIWGSRDMAVPVEEAEELERLIFKSKLIIYNGFSHYAYLENLNQTVSDIDKFLVKESMEGKNEN